MPSDQYSNEELVALVEMVGKELQAKAEAEGHERSRKWKLAEQKRLALANAAPELLESLKIYVHAFAHGAGVPPHLEQQAIAAILKAEGR